MVATPIGNARDITLRALDILANADVLAAEDTRSLRRLMAIHGIAINGRPVLAYHDHNGPKARPKLLAMLAEGKSVAFAPEAGSPAISDPGFALAAEARTAGFAVTAAPGVSAAITALSVAGLATDRFLFVGFLPTAKNARRAALSEYAATQATLVLYESPHRVEAMLSDAADVLGVDRPAALCRELTKKFEEVRACPLGELATATRDKAPKGEIVVLIGRGAATVVSEAVIESAVSSALDTMTVRDAAASVAADLNVRKRHVYQIAMRLSEDRQTKG